jgi:4-amino-4-deoxy-L-arabinose transferase-like glycosyltransferase
MLTQCTSLFFYSSQNWIALVLSLHFVGNTFLPVYFSYGTLLSAFAVCLGAASAFLASMKDVRRRTKGTWYLNAWLLVVMIIFIVLGIVLTPSHPSYRSLYDAIIPMVNTGMWGLTGAATAAASIRCFRLKNVETTLIMIPAIILVLMNTPFWDASWEGFAAMGTWLNNVPSTAGNRGYIIGAAIGAIAVSLRT